MFHRVKISIGVGLVAAATVLTGCATSSQKGAQQSASSAAAEQTQGQSATAATPPSMPKLVGTFVDHPLTIYDLDTQRYNFFVGGVLSAHYNTAEQTLTLTSAEKPPLTCRYRRGGQLIMETNTEESEEGQAAKSEEEQAAYRDQCEQLVATLYENLQ